RLKDQTLAVAATLLERQHDFDFAIPEAVQQAHPDRDTLQVGEVRYRAVLMAPSDFWPEEALDVLLDYIKGGGKVVFLGRQPLSIQRLLFRTGVVRVGEDG